MVSQLKVEEHSLHFGVKKNKLWINIEEGDFRVLVKSLHHEHNRSDGDG